LNFAAGRQDGIGAEGNSPALSSKRSPKSTFAVRASRWNSWMARAPGAT